MAIIMNSLYLTLDHFLPSIAVYQVLLHICIGLIFSVTVFFKGQGCGSQSGVCITITSRVPVDLEWGPQICISNSFPGDTNAADPGPHFENHRTYIMVLITQLYHFICELSMLLKPLVALQCQCLQGNWLTKQISEQTLKHWFLLSTLDVRAGDPWTTICEIFDLQRSSCAPGCQECVFYLCLIVFYTIVAILCFCVSPTRIPQREGLCLSHHYNSKLSDAD